jgi:hypothetical protein
MPKGSTNEGTSIKYRKRQIPIATQKQIELLVAENQQLKEQVQEQADALIELAEILAEVEEDG